LRLITMLPLPVAMQRRGIGGCKEALLPVGKIFGAPVRPGSCVSSDVGIEIGPLQGLVATSLNRAGVHEFLLVRGVDEHMAGKVGRALHGDTTMFTGSIAA